MSYESNQIAAIAGERRTLKVARRIENLAKVPGSADETRIDDGQVDVDRGNLESELVIDRLPIGTTASAKRWQGQRSGRGKEQRQNATQHYNGGAEANNRRTNKIHF